MKKWLAVILVIVMMLAGCTEGKDEQQVSQPNVTENTNTINSDEGAVQVGNNQRKFSAGTVSDLKRKYGSEDSQVMPMYNVAPDHIFHLGFKTDMRDIAFDIDYDFEIASVHTDKRASEESMIKSLVAVDRIGKTVTVEPTSPVLPMEKDFNDTWGTWGNAPIYYLRINYDMDSTEPKLLDEPLIIPFTIKKEVATPTLRYEISRDGVLKLVWEPVEGADSYHIYRISSIFSDENVTTGGAELAFGQQEFLSLSKIAEVETHEFEDWGGKPNGLDYMSSAQTMMFEQNSDLRGDYFIVAVKDGKESLASNIVVSNKIGHLIPRGYEVWDELFEEYAHADQLPRSLNIVMVDLSIKQYPVIYDPANAEYIGGGATVPFSIPGTALFGSIYVEQTTPGELATLPQEVKGNTTSALVEPKNETDYVPSPDVPTIIPRNGESEPDLNSEEITVDVQKEHTERIVEQANQAALPLFLEDAPLNVDTALEEYLALHMLAASSEVSLEAFPEAQNFETISDVLQEVMYQNPLILSVDAWLYNYKTLTLRIRYSETPEEIWSKQEEILAEAKTILPAIIQDGMTDEEKREAIYRYLADQTTYDYSALQAAEANNFKGDIGDEFNDSFTTYGIMVNKVGVCMSYAYSYKLLSDLAGLNSIVVTGVADGVPHAWNKVKIGEEWLHVDVTNNDSEDSLGFRLLYNSSDDAAVAVNSILSDEYWRDSEIDQFYSINNSHDYYVVNQLEAASMDRYSDIFTRELLAGKSLIVIRYTGEFDEDQLHLTVGELLEEHAPEALDTALLGSMGNYIIYFDDNGE